MTHVTPADPGPETPPTAPSGYVRDEGGLAMDEGAHVSFLLSQVGFESSRRFGETLHSLDLEPRHFALLNYVHGNEGRSQQALGEVLHIPPSRMVGLLDDLEARDLVERRPSPADRRAHAVHLTRRGSHLLEQATEVARLHEQMVVSQLSAEDRSNLAQLLLRVAESLGLSAGVHPGLQQTGEAPSPCPKT